MVRVVEPGSSDSLGEFNVFKHVRSDPNDVVMIVEHGRYL